MNLFLMTVSLKTIWRNKVVSIFIIWCITIGVAALTLTGVNFFNQIDRIEQKYPKDQILKLIEFHHAIPYREALSLVSGWEKDGYLIEGLPLTYHDVMVSMNQSSGNATFLLKKEM